MCHTTGFSRLLAGLLFAVTMSGATAALAQGAAFPAKGITIVVPFPPAGSSDRAVRLIGRKMAENTGQPVIIDNKSGGNGVIGVLAVKQAPPDGYTLFMAHTATHAINVALYDKLPYNPSADFRPVTTFMSFPSYIVVPAASPVKTVADLVALARTQKGGLTYSSQGIGTPGHLLGAMMQKLTGGEYVHIPMKGAAAATLEVVAGRVDLLFSSYGTAAPFIKDGRLRVIAIASGTRSALLPNIPTMTEAGFPGVELDYWFGMLAPAGTPDAVIQRLNTEIIKAVRNPEVAAALTAEGIEIITSTPEQFVRLIAEDTARLGRVVRDIGAKAE